MMLLLGSPLAGSAVQRLLRSQLGVKISCREILVEPHGDLMECLP